MSSVDMCEHDWPGSGCRECFPRPASGGVGFRFDVCMTPGDPACDEWEAKLKEHLEEYE